ncbi:hypothetical protein DVH05_016595 [Phytophthora capsici]|nr:hypothetical protein DVH05_016595 [Phytophthora capsici]
MKTSLSILAAMAMLAVAALNVPGSLANQVGVDAVVDEASWAPRRALESMAAPYQQGPPDGGIKRRNPNTKDDKHGPRVLGQAPAVTPASTTSTATPAPTKTNPPKATPAATTTSSSNVTPVPAKPKVTPAATKPKPTPAVTKGKTASSSNSYMQKDTPTKPKPTPASTTNQSKPKVTPSATKPSTPKTPTPTVANKGSSPVQQKHRSLRDNEPKQQQHQQKQKPHDPPKRTPKIGNKHH